MKTLTCHRRTLSKLRLLYCIQANFSMWHEVCDAPVDHIKTSNKISYKHEDSKQEPQSPGGSQL